MANSNLHLTQEAEMENPNPHLPHEILTEIFSRLPAKSVGKCRCLSKSWRSDLSTSTFIKLHLNRSKTQQESLILMDYDGLETITPPDTDDNLVSKELYLEGDWGQVLGSCHGLVLLQNKWYQISLVNPTTQELLHIPDNPTLMLKEPNGKKLCLMRRETGFGYDSSSDDYKIVRLCYYNDSDLILRPGEFSFYAFVDVYSLKSCVWRSINWSPFVEWVKYHEKGVFVSGALHWLCGCSPYYLIIAFDLTGEVFRKIPCPAMVRNAKYEFNAMSVLGGCLSMVEKIESSDGLCFHVWVMKEYGSAASWTKYLIDARGGWGRRKPLCFIKDKVILYLYDFHLLEYDLEKETTKEMKVNGRCGSTYSGGATFVESLVSLPNGNTFSTTGMLRRFLDEESWL